MNFISSSGQQHASKQPGSRVEPDSDVIQQMLQRDSSEKRNYRSQESFKQHGPVVLDTGIHPGSSGSDG